MKLTLLPGTELKVSRLSFGTARLHRHATTARRQALLAAAWDQGFTHFDTSPYYGYGISESELGRFLRRCGASATAASKVGIYPPGGRTSNAFTAWTRKALGKIVPSISNAIVDWSLKTAAASLEQTLRTLGRDRLDILFLHEPTPQLLDAEEFQMWLARQRDAGKIRYWGLAGPLERFAEWVNHPLGQILQVRDMISAPDTVKLTLAGRRPQFTYGVIPSGRDRPSVQQVVREALVRNSEGSVLVSTQRIPHLRELALTTF